jgi:hypothetical protein
MMNRNVWRSVLDRTENKKIKINLAYNLLYEFGALDCTVANKIHEKKIASFS